MVDFVACAAAAEVVFGDDTGMITAETACGPHTCGDRSLSDQSSHLFVGSSIVLDVSNVFDMFEVLEFAVGDAARQLTMRVCMVVPLLKQTMLRNVLESFVHPAAITAIVIFIAIDQLLD